MRKPYGITVFCDDIRYETSGKSIYIGVYHNTLNLVTKEPTALPVLHCAARLMVPSDMQAKQLVFKILQEINGEEKVLVEGPIIAVNESLNASKDKEKFVYCLSHLAISPLIITSNFILKSRAYLDGEEVRLGVLAVEMGAVPTSQPSASSALET